MAQEATFTLPDGLLELRDLIEEGWPAQRAALHAAGVPLALDTPPDPAPPAPPAPPDPAPPAATPPWGDDDFDPNRAWNLIQGLRGDVDKIKIERDDLRTQVQKHEDATKTEQEKAAERAAEAEHIAATATSEAARLRVALKKGLTETQAKRLVGNTEEELEADADELLASFTPEGDPDPGRRPTVRLRPGAVPSSESEETDPAKLASLVPRRY